MQKFLIILIFIISGCSHTKHNQRTPANYEDEGIDILNFPSYFDVNLEQHTFTIQNLKNFDLKYKISASNNISFGSSPTACSFNNNDYSYLSAGSSCNITILRPNNYKSLSKENINIKIKGQYEINEDIYFKNYNKNFCKSINTVIDTYHKENSSHPTYSAWEVYKYKNINIQRNPSIRYNNSCGAIKEQLDDSFDIKSVYKYCQKNITIGKNKYLDQLDDFDIGTVCDDAEY